MDLEEEASVGNVFTMEKKGIENLSVPSAKEGQIREPKTQIELQIGLEESEGYP